MAVNDIELGRRGDAHGKCDRTAATMDLMAVLSLVVVKELGKCRTQ
jgi:hypothetical protein